MQHGRRDWPRGRVSVLGIPGCLLIGGIIPVVPPCSQNVAAQLAVHEERGSKGAPGPAEINFRDAVGCSEPAAVENISELYDPQRLRRR